MKRRYLMTFFAVWVLLGAGCSDVPWSSGDRVLVSKFLHDTELAKPQRYDVVVFKYPVRPIEKGVPKNYIKRLLGLPGQLVAILFGQLFFLDPEGEAPLFPEPHSLVTKEGKVYKGFVLEDKDGQVVFQAFQGDRPGSRYVEQPFDRDDIESIAPIPEEERWKHRLPGFANMDETDVGNDFDFMLEDHPWAHKWYRMGKLKIMRKPPDVMLAMRRIVYDNDFQPRDLVGERFQRWLPRAGSAWKSDSPTSFAAESQNGKDIDWLRYRHLVVESPVVGPRLALEDPAPRLITDLYGYNKVDNNRDESKPNWVGDLMLECTLDVADPKGEFWMELSRGIDRFSARFDLATGQCTLFRETDGGQREELATRETSVKAKGSYQLRFANFDARLTVWVNGDLPFDQGHDYEPPEVPRAGEIKDQDEEGFAIAIAKRRGPTKNDFEPASLGVNGATLKVKQIRLWRDTYYSRFGHRGEPLGDLFSTEGWDDFRRMAPTTYYVQPRHYLCLGDNSTMSSDGRDWGLVPERLLLGRAHVVYYPFNRAGPIR